MKHYINLIFLFLFLIVSWAYNRLEGNNPDPNNQHGLTALDSIKIIRSSINREYKNGLVLYHPKNLYIDFVQIRPDTSDSSIFFCIPAAFTTTTNHIDGLCLDDGLIINNGLNMSVQGGVWDLLKFMPVL